MAFLDSKNLVSYLQKSKREICVYSTGDHLFFGDGFSLLFRTEHDRRLSFYEPPVKNTNYIKQAGKDGAFLESDRFHSMTIWNNFMNDQSNIHEVKATDYHCQVGEKSFIRKFTSSDKSKVAWIKKEITDTLDTLALYLNNDYKFELKEGAFLRVYHRFSSNSGQPVPLAIFMLHLHEEEE